MRIAFYAPLKSPRHPVPSGDRLMARQLMAALRQAGHEVELASELRSFAATPDPAALAVSQTEAAAEMARLAAMWQGSGAPDLWFTYHPYYKAPDLIGPALARRFCLPYVTAECSYSRRRDAQGWAGRQEPVLAGIRQAAVNICLTRRDRDGLIDAALEAKTALMRPFIDPTPFLAAPPGRDPHRLVTVAMMRPGDKMESYRALARALALLPAALPWRLTVVGDGPERAAVEALFTRWPDRVSCVGELAAPAVAEILSRTGLCVWPGCGEAYGLAYLEAQAAGLPVVAQAVAGVPEVVRDGVTGLLVPAGDDAGLAAAIARLAQGDEARRFGAAAREFVLSECSIDGAARRLGAILCRVKR